MTANRGPEVREQTSVNHAALANSAVDPDPVGGPVLPLAGGIDITTSKSHNPDMQTDAMARNLFGRSAIEAIRLGECIRCAEMVTPDAWPEVDRREYDITALCPTCWDVLFPPEED